MKISVVTACRNSAATIESCIYSVQAQCKADVEHILIDGASDDGTLKITRKYSQHFSHSVSEKDDGVYAAMNKGILAASGDIVGILNADDLYASTDVLSQISKLFKDPTLDACFGDLCYVDRSDPSRIVRYWRAGPYRIGKLHHGWMPPHPTLFVRRNLYEKYGLYREDLATAADYELMLRLLLRHQIRVAYIPKVLVNMRTGGASNASWSARFKANRMDRLAWEVNGLRPYPWTLAAKPLRKIPQWWRRPVQD